MTASTAPDIPTLHVRILDLLADRARRLENSLSTIAGTDVQWIRRSDRFSNYEDDVSVALKSLEDATSTRKSVLLLVHWSDFKSQSSAVLNGSLANELTRVVAYSGGILGSESLDQVRDRFPGATVSPMRLEGAQRDFADVKSLILGMIDGHAQMSKSLHTLPQANRILLRLLTKELQQIQSSGEPKGRFEECLATMSWWRTQLPGLLPADFLASDDDTLKDQLIKFT